VPWTADTIPPELTAILDARAGKEHSATGAVRSCLAEILNAYDELRSGSAPRVPTLRCPACGHPDTTMRSCAGGYSIGWGMCLGEHGSHQLSLPDEGLASRPELVAYVREVLEHNTVMRPEKDYITTERLATNMLYSILHRLRIDQVLPVADDTDEETADA
jgi:hypothetical protein